MQTLDAAERLILTFAARLAPWLMLAPTAWLVFDRTIQHLRWPWPVALIAAAGLELLGVAILASLLQLRSYNRTKRKTDPQAPLILPAMLVALYLLAAEALTVVLHIWPGAAAPIAPALFPVLSAAAFALLALRADHQHRLAEIAADKADRRAARLAARSLPGEAPPPAWTGTLVCAHCARSFSWPDPYPTGERAQKALNAHQRAHAHDSP